ncbi:MAG: MMPL family transporter [Planctomycetota bacterium]|nr:MMPL family transporter [Planctomycetota bacterium]
MAVTTIRAIEDRIFSVLAALVLSHPWWVITCGVILSVAGFIVGSFTITLNADTDDLINPNVSYMQAYRQLIDEFGDMERMWVVIDVHESTGDAASCAEWLEASFRSEESLGRVHGGISPREQLIMASRSMVPEQLEVIVSACAVLSSTIESKDPLAMLAKEMTRGLSGNPWETGALHRQMAATLTVVTWLIQGPPEMPVQPLVSDSGRYLFIGIMPPKDYGTLGVIDTPLREVRSILDSARARYPGVEMGLTGKPVLQADEMATSDRDMLRAALLAVVLVGLVIMLVLRTARRPMLAMGAFACAAGWTYGIVGLLVGQLNLLSIVFMLVLIGVGLDFGVHIISRYAEFRRQRGPVGSIRGLYLTVMRGNAAAVLTSSATFFVAWFTDFQGLRELGIIAGIGLLLCFLSMSSVLPSLLVVTDRTPRPKLERLAGTDVDWADRLSHRPLTVVSIAALLSIALIPLSLSIEFERNLLELQATGIESAQWERKVTEDSDSASWFAAAIVENRQHVEAMERKAANYVTIGRVQSVSTLLGQFDDSRTILRESLQSCELGVIRIDPSTIDQNLDAVSAPLELMAPRAGDSSVVIESLLGSIRGLPSEDEQAAGLITQNAEELKVFLSEIRRGDQLPLREALPEEIRNQVLSSHGNYLVMLHPSENVWDYEAMGRFIKDVREVAPQVTGVPITHYESLDAMRDAFVTMMALALILITVITAVAFRNVMDVVICLLTLCIGLWWTVGAMAFFGVSFNLANFFAAPILVGLGIDGSLHMVHRWKEGGPDRLKFGGTRRAVVLTSMTTMIGFGCLVIAEHKGLRSLGIVMALGSAACMIAVVVLLPSLLALRERWVRQ